MDVGVRYTPRFKNHKRFRRFPRGDSSHLTPNEEARPIGRASSLSTKSKLHQFRQMPVLWFQDADLDRVMHLQTFLAPCR
jgi:hypothetical protein